jgi:hypothetical protein
VPQSKGAHFMPVDDYPGSLAPGSDGMSVVLPFESDRVDESQSFELAGMIY